MEILYAFLIVTAIGFLASVLLSLASKLFFVKTDEKVTELRAMLPGVNCGACGYTGCDEYAKALAKGEADPNLCIPGAADVANAIGDYLGVETTAKEVPAAFVHCNGSCGAAKISYDYQGPKSCKAASALFGGQYDCKYGCLGFGDCASACPNDAICIEDGIARVLPERCVGCGLCVETCPKRIISLLPRNDHPAVYCNNKDKGAAAKKACDNACISCKKCEKACPSAAIKVENNLAAIDYALCTGCGACAETCPTGCIKERQIPVDRS